MRNEDDAGMESFLPMYVYDAIKVKKRFEHMRVSVFIIIRFLSFPFLHSPFSVLHFPFVPF